MGSRSYARDNRGRFHGSAGAAKVTTGRAGGFANASFRSRVIASRVAGKKGASAQLSASKSNGKSFKAKARNSRGRLVNKALHPSSLPGQAVRNAVVGGAAGLALNTAINVAEGGGHSIGVRAATNRTNAGLAATHGLGSGIVKEATRSVFTGSHNITTAKRRLR